MALSVDQIRILVKAETAKALKNLKGVHGQSQKVSMGFKDILKTGLGITGIIGAIRLVTGAVKKAIKTQMQFEQSIANVASVSGDSRKELGKLARQMGRDTVFSATQSADAMYFLASAGLKVKDMSKVLAPTLNLAAAAQMGIAEATDLVVNQLKIYQAEMGKAEEFTDIMAHTVASSNTNMTQLGSALSYTSSIANRVGISFEDLNVTLAGLADLGIKGERAGIQLRMGLTRLIKPTGQAAEVLAKYNINQRQVNEALNDPIKLFKLLQPVTNNAADATALFGLRQQDLIGLIQKGIPNLEKLKKGMEGAGGAAKRMADVQSNTLTGQLRLLNGAWEELMISFSKTKQLKEVVRGIRNIVLWLGEMNNMFETVRKAHTTYVYQHHKETLAMASAIRGLKNLIELRKKDLKEKGESVKSDKIINAWQKSIIKLKKKIANIAKKNADTSRKANKEKIKGEKEVHDKQKSNLKKQKDLYDNYYSYTISEYQKAINKENEIYKKASEGLKQLFEKRRDEKSRTEHDSFILLKEFKHKEKELEELHNQNLIKLAKEKKDKKIKELTDEQKIAIEIFEKTGAGIASAIGGGAGEAIQGITTLMSSLAQAAATGDATAATMALVGAAIGAVFTEIAKGQEFREMQTQNTLDNLKNIEAEYLQQQLDNLKLLHFAQTESLLKRQEEEMNFFLINSEAGKAYNAMKAQEEAERVAAMDATEKAKYDIEKKYIEEREKLEKEQAVEAKALEDKQKAERNKIKKSQFRLEKRIALDEAWIKIQGAFSDVHSKFPMPWDKGTRNSLFNALQSTYDKTSSLIKSRVFIPEFQKGTLNAPQGMGLVGERGPELVNFKGGEQVIPNNRISNYTTNANRNIVIENVSLPNITNTREMLLEMQEIADGMGTSLLNV